MRCAARDQAAHLRPDARDAVGALGDRRSELPAFAFARRHEVGQDGVEQCHRIGLQAGRIESQALHQARHLQQRAEFHPQHREPRKQVAGQPGEFVRARRIQAEPRAALRRAQAQHQVELAARHALRDALAQRGFECAQFLRQPDRHFEEAMVDRTQLATEQAALGGPLAGGVGGHAADGHRVSTTGEAAGKYATRSRHRAPARTPPAASG